MSAPGTYSGAGKTGLGSYTQEDDDVASNVAKAASPTSPLIQQAEQAGVDQANSRGLLNSTIAGGAARAEAYKVALPIGQQQAQQASQRNQSNQAFEQTNETAAEGNKSQERIATGAQQTQRDISAANNASQERIGAAQNTSQEGIAAGNQGTQRDITAANNAAELERSMRNLTSNENIAKLDNDSKLAVQQMTIDSQERIANMNVSSNQQDKASSAAVTATNIYASMANAIASNANIPADARTSLMQNAKNMLDANLGLVEQLYNIDLHWDIGSFDAPTTDNTTGPEATNYGNGGGTGLLDDNPDAGSTDNAVSYTDENGNQYNAAGQIIGNTT